MDVGVANQRVKGRRAERVGPLVNRSWLREGCERTERGGLGRGREREVGEGAVAESVSGGSKF
jgi:hypothetical protein